MSGTEKKSKESQLGKSSTKFNAEDVVLAKIRGFPSWPGIVVDDNDVPSAVLDERPVVKHREQYTIRFFPAADYHWAFAKDLELLTPAKIDQWLSNQSRKKGDLRKAYELARDPKSWNAEQNTIVKNYERSLQEAAEEDEENEDQLQEDEDEGVDENESVANKKRKRPAETGKVRESASKGKKSKVAEAAKSKQADKGNISVDANGDSTMADEALDPETRKVKDWRMKLQKAFLPKNEQIKEADMPQLDAVFKTVEEYDEITADQLRATKIGKVTKKIMHLTNVPHDDEYHFRSRAEKLCVKWGAIMASAASSHENGTTSGAEKSQADTTAVAHMAKSEQESPAKSEGAGDQKTEDGPKSSVEAQI